MTYEYKPVFQTDIPRKISKFWSKMVKGGEIILAFATFFFPFHLGLGRTNKTTSPSPNKVIPSPPGIAFRVPEFQHLIGDIVSRKNPLRQSPPSVHSVFWRERKWEFNQFSIGQLTQLPNATWCETKSVQTKAPLIAAQCGCHQAECLRTLEPNEIYL